MNFDFDTFEFTGLIAPGSVVVLAVALLNPLLLRLANPAILIALAILVAYVVGHLIAALGNIAEPLFEAVGVHDLASLSVKEWRERGYMTDDQKERFPAAVSERFCGEVPPDGPDLKLRRKLLVRQMSMFVVATARGQRLTTFDGLYSLSRGLTVAFLICVPTAIVATQYVAAVSCAVVVGLMVYRSRKFADRSATELIQQFLLADQLISIRLQRSATGEARDESLLVDPL